MNGKAEQIKGRVKEAAGAMTDNNRLRQEGKADQNRGKVKEAVDRVAKATKRAIDRASGK